MAKHLNAYMAFDRIQGPSEGAMLVFATNAQQARKLSFGVGFSEWSQWIDWVATKIKDLPEHLQALADQGPVIECPPVCPSCKHWGGHTREFRMCSRCWDEEYAQGIREAINA